MTENLIANAAVTIGAPRARVWDALVNPSSIKEYMFGAEVASDWTQGSPITWKGEWEGKPYEDKGEVLYVETGKTVSYSHFSPLSGLPDKPENYHTVTVTLDGDDNRTEVELTQDNNPTEEAREHSEQNWKTMLDGLKKFVEGKSG